MIFVDTSAWVALADSRDRRHLDALRTARRVAAGEFGRQVTTNYVMVEALTLIRDHLGPEKAGSFASGIDGSDEIRVFWIDRDHHRQAVQMMVKHPDKHWSICDCASFVVMQTFGIDHAFAYDADFAQAGFTPVG